MPSSRADRLIVQVAKLYYEQELSQAEVAAAVGLSRSNISRILSSAKQRGIVEIIIHDPEFQIKRSIDLEQRIISRYQIQQVIVVEVSHSAKNALELVSRAGSDWIKANVQGVRSIGISWGKTMQTLVRELPKMNLPVKPKVFPLVGGLNSMDTVESGFSVVQMLAERLCNHAEQFYAPAVLASKITYDAMIAEPSIKKALQQAAEVDLGVVGIGTFGLHASSEILTRMSLSESEYAELLSQNPVGDICGRFYDANGKALGSPTSTRMMAVTIPELIRIPQLVALAAGAEKIPGVHGALRTGAVNTLIIDSNLAEALLASN